MASKTVATKNHIRTSPRNIISGKYLSMNSKKLPTIKRKCSDEKIIEENYPIKKLIITSYTEPCHSEDSNDLSQIDNIKKQDLFYKRIERFNKDNKTTIVYTCSMGCNEVTISTIPNLSEQQEFKLKEIVEEVFGNVKCTVKKSAKKPSYTPTVSPGQPMARHMLQKAGFFTKANNQIYVVSTGHDTIIGEKFFALNENKEFAIIKKCIDDEYMDVSISKIKSQNIQLENAVTKNGVKIRLHGICSESNIFNCDYTVEKFCNGNSMDEIKVMIEESHNHDFTIMKFKKFVKIFKTDEESGDYSIHKHGDSGLVIICSPSKKTKNKVYLMLTGILYGDNRIECSVGLTLSSILDELKKDDRFKTLELL